LLRILVARAPNAVRRDELLDEIWGQDAYPTTRTVDTHIANLRAKLEDDAQAPRHVVTVHGVGYRWSFDVKDA
jgi:DNA-binding response OmpR family regulator